MIIRISSISLESNSNWILLIKVFHRLLLEGNTNSKENCKDYKEYKDSKEGYKDNKNNKEFSKTVYE